MDRQSSLTSVARSPGEQKFSQLGVTAAPGNVSGFHNRQMPRVIHGLLPFELNVLIISGKERVDIVRTPFGESFLKIENIPNALRPSTRAAGRQAAIGRLQKECVRRGACKNRPIDIRGVEICMMKIGYPSSQADACDGGRRSGCC